MAWLEQTSSGRYHIAFCYGGLKYKLALKTSDSRLASARVQCIHENIGLLESGRLVLTENTDLGEFLLSDGQLNTRRDITPKRKLRTFSQFSKAFLASIPENSLEKNTLQGMDTSIKHLKRVMGAPTPLSQLELTDIQNYVDQRTND